MSDLPVGGARPSSAVIYILQVKEVPLGLHQLLCSPACLDTSELGGIPGMYQLVSGSFTKVLYLKYKKQINTFLGGTYFNLFKYFILGDLLKLVLS